MFNKKKFWREGKRVRKIDHARDEIEDVNVQILRDCVEVGRSLAEYFKQVLNVEDVRKNKCKWRLADATVGRIE